MKLGSLFDGSGGFPRIVKAQENVDQLLTICSQLMIQKLPGGKRYELRTEAGDCAAGVS